MKPAAMLIGAFKINICGEVAVKFCSFAHHRGEGRARIKPDIQRVVALFIMRSIWPQKLVGGNALPALNAFLLDALGNRHQ